VHLSILALLVAMVVAACDSEPLRESDQPDAYDAGEARDGGATSADTGMPEGDAGQLEPDAAVHEFAADYASGSRLHAKLRVTDDGARAFLGWYDSERAADCAFRRASDGLTRCMPFSPDTTTHTFSDPQCTQPVLLLNVERCEPALPAFVSVDTYSVCDTIATLVYPRENKLAGSVTVYSDDGSGCMGREIDPLRQEAYGVGEAIDPASFVAAEEVVQPTGERLAATALVAEDGSVERLGWYDTELETACQSGELQDDSVPRCVPSDAVFDDGSLFTDAQCSERAALGVAECSADVPFVGRYEMTACSWAWSYFERGARVPGADAYMSASGCESASATRGDPYWGVYRVGDALTASRLAALETTYVGSERIRQVVEQAEGGATRVTRVLHDSTLNATCSFEKAADGATRCLPLSVYPFRYAADAACTTLLASRNAPTGCDVAVDVVALDEPSDDQCGGFRRAFAAGAPFAAAVVYQGGPDNCAESSSDGRLFVSVGDEIPADDLVGQTIMIETP
jgi:hypothetical protein